MIFSADIFKVYCADHTYTTLKLPYDITVEAIMAQAADKLCLGDELVMCEVKSNGGRFTSDGKSKSFCYSYNI